MYDFSNFPGMPPMPDAAFAAPSPIQHAEEFDATSILPHLTQRLFGKFAVSYEAADSDIKRTYVIRIQRLPRTSKGKPLPIIEIFKLTGAFSLVFLPNITDDEVLTFNQAIVT